MGKRVVSGHHPLLWIESFTSPDLRRLRTVLRERRGALCWVGVWHGLGDSWRSYKPAERRAIARMVLRQQDGEGVLGRLPSDIKRQQDLEGLLRHWYQGVSKWQIVVPGEPSWTPEEALIWKRALDHAVGCWLWRYVQADLLVEKVGEWMRYAKRRLLYFVLSTANRA